MENLTTYINTDILRVVVGILITILGLIATLLIIRWIFCIDKIVQNLTDINTSLKECKLLLSGIDDALRQRKGEK
jgi:hypothetical protein